MKTEHINYEINDQILYLGFGKNSEKSMSVLDEKTLVELGEIITHVKSEQKNLSGLVFHSMKPGCFLAGADINLINTLNEESEAAEGAAKGQLLFNEIEDLRIPTLALVDGVCLGGGLELALACNQIICSDSPKTSLGLPEVKLGILPGFGGTFRLPKKVGLPTALDLILAGKTCNSRKAKKVGLVSEVYPSEKLLKMVQKHLKPIKKKKSLSESLQGIASENLLGKKLIFQKARESVMKLTKGQYQAPLKIIDLLESHSGKGRDSYLAHEASAFAELCVGEQSKNLRHIFFMMENSKKIPKDFSGNTKDLKRGAALGAGTMGGGIAWLMANNNMAPIMKDIGQEALELGYKQSSRNFKAALKRKRISQDKFENLQRSIQGQLNYDGFKSVDLVIEAIIENMDLKKRVFSEVEKEVTDDCLITSNTSSLSVAEMSTALEKPGRFAGLHFFNPVNKMPLVEIITHDNVDKETVASLYKWVLKTKKTPVIVKDGPGFLVNRILMPYLNEAGFLLTEGVSIEDLDNACLKFGFPMGPCRLLDEIGIDVAEKVAHIMHEGLGDRAKDSGQSNFMVENKFLGRKTSKGFYLYDENGKSTGVNPAVAQKLNSNKKMDVIDIQMRMILPMINEAAYILEDEIVKNAQDVDLGLVFGIGFPPFRGGLLKYADSEGLDRLLKAIEGFENSVSSERFKPAPYLVNLVKNKTKFYDQNPA